jgi:melanoma-associated antigen p97
LVFISRPYDQLPTLLCIEGGDEFDCMYRISENQADLLTLDPGLAYTAGEYYTMMPLMAERYALGKSPLYS